MHVIHQPHTHLVETIATYKCISVLPDDVGIYVGTSTFSASQEGMKNITHLHCS